MKTKLSIRFGLPINDGRPACLECGSRTWTASVIDDRGVRKCADCLDGTTAMRRKGVPIAKTTRTSA